MLPSDWQAFLIRLPYRKGAFFIKTVLYSPHCPLSSVTVGRGGRGAYAAGASSSS